MLRHIPNLISGLRIAAAPLLVALAAGGDRRGFAVLMVAAFASDILDGAIARRFGFVSALGAILDSIADILLFPAVAFGVWHFNQALLQTHGLLFLGVVGLWLGASLLAILRYGKLASFHTILTRISATALGFFVIALMFFGFLPWLLWTAVALVIVSQAEEMVLMALLPDWTPDVPGLLWHLRRHRAPL